MAERALAAGTASGQGLGVLCIHLDGFEDRCKRDGEAKSIAFFIELLQSMPFDPSRVLCGHREGAKAIFYVQGGDSKAMRSLGQACCDAPSTSRSRAERSVGLSVGAAHSSGQHNGRVVLENVRLAAIRGARLVLRTGGGRFAFIERFGPAMVRGAQHEASTPKDPAQERASVQKAIDSLLPTEPTFVLRPQAKDGPRTQESAHPSPQEGSPQFEEWMRSSELAWQRRVDLLERRLEKMGRLLDGAEHQKRPVRSESGVASRFQSVQGLDQTDDQFEAKAGLMSALFTANKKIHDNLKSRTAG